MKTLAIDLATKTGWAFGDDITSAHSGVWTLPGFDDANLNPSLGSIYSMVFSTCKANNIQAFVLEASLLGIKRKNQRGIVTPTSHHGDRVLGFASGAARAGAINAGVKYIMTPSPATWRAAVLGNGYPENPKAEALNYCKMLGLSITSADEAEARCMLQYARGKLIHIERGVT